MEGVSAHTHKLVFLKMQKDPHFEVFDNIISSEIKLALKSSWDFVKIWVRSTNFGRIVKYFFPPPHQILTKWNEIFTKDSQMIELWSDCSTALVNIKDNC